MIRLKINYVLAWIFPLAMILATIWKEYDPINCVGTFAVLIMFFVTSSNWCEEKPQTQAESTESVS
jgi:hypothetical protein